MQTQMMGMLAARAASNQKVEQVCTLGAIAVSKRKILGQMGMLGTIGV